VLIPKFKLVWEDITYRIKYDKKDLKKLGLPDHVKEKTLLEGVSGHAKSGETTFIMGSSGAGKTTLLNSLCDRITKNKKNIFSGSVTINDSIEVEQKTFGNYGSYVMQDDVLFETFTCYECLFFAAKLRLNRTMDIILERIEEVIA
jgi:ABC-type multidrug transport system ATPase subunit